MESLCVVPSRASGPRSLQGRSHIQSLEMAGERSLPLIVVSSVWMNLTLGIADYLLWICRITRDRRAQGMYTRRSGVARGCALDMSWPE